MKRKDAGNTKNMCNDPRDLALHP